MRGIWVLPHAGNHGDTRMPKMLKIGKSTSHIDKMKGVPLRKKALVTQAYLKCFV